MQRLYLDLFDDGIPAPDCNPLMLKGRGQSAAPLDPGKVSFVRRAADTLRIQILLAVLFERKIVVPGAWVTSSPMFLAVVGEFLDHFPGRIEKAGVAGALRVQTDSPFVFAFGPEAGQGHGMQQLARSLHWRVEKDRRLMFSPALSRRGLLPAADEAELRRTLASGIGQVLDGPVASMPDEMPRHLYRALARVGEAEVAEQAAHGFTAVLKHLNRYGSDHLTSFDPRHYEQQMAREVLRVRDAVDLRASGALDDGELHGFRHFFQQARAQDIPDAQLMRLWGCLSSIDMPEADRWSLEAFGRYVLNRGYAASLGAGGFSAVSFDAYTRERTRPVDKVLLDRLMPSATPEHAMAPLHDFVSLANARRHGHDLFDMFDWKDVWAAVGDIASDEAWRRNRQKLLDELRALDPQALDEADPWMAFFDGVNAELRGYMSLDPGVAFKDGFLTVVRDVSKVAADVQGHVGKALSPDAALIAKVSLSALSFLLKGVENSPRTVLKGERLYRRVVTHGAFLDAYAMLITMTGH